MVEKYYCDFMGRNLQPGQTFVLEPGHIKITVGEATTNDPDAQTPFCAVRDAAFILTEPNKKRGDRYSATCHECGGVLDIEGEKIKKSRTRKPRP